MTPLTPRMKGMLDAARAAEAAKTPVSKKGTIAAGLKEVAKGVAPAPLISRAMTDTGYMIKRGVGAIKQGINNFRAGRKAEADAEDAQLRKTNALRLKNIGEGNPEKNLSLDKYKD